MSEGLSNALQEQEAQFEELLSKFSKVSVKKRQLHYLAKFLRDQDVEILQLREDSDSISDEINKMQDDMDVNFAQFKQKMYTKMVNLS